MAEISEAVLVDSDFHKDVILETIKYLNAPGLNASKGRIKDHLVDHYKIGRMETEICLRTLVNRGIITLVHHRQGIRYVESTEYDDYGVILNRPCVSNVLVNVLRHLTRSVFDNEGQGFTVSDIRQCLSSVFQNSREPELEGVELLRSLLIEGRHGQLCLLPNGRYLLDEDNNHKGIVDRTSDPYDFPILEEPLNLPVSPIRSTSTIGENVTPTTTQVRATSPYGPSTSHNINVLMVSEVHQTDSYYPHAPFEDVHIPERSTNRNADQQMYQTVPLSILPSTPLSFEGGNMLHNSNQSQDNSSNIPSTYRFVDVSDFRGSYI